MALQWMDGFEHYGLLETHMLEGVGGGAAWSQVDNNFDLSNANPATGSYHMRLTDTSTTPDGLRRAYPSASQVSAVGYRMALDDLPATEGYGWFDTQLSLVDFMDVANDRHCRVAMGTDGGVYFCRNDTLLGRSDPCIAAGGYHHLEVKTKIADGTDGYGEVRVNEVTVLNVTGVDTANTANLATAQVVVRLQASAVSSTVGFGFMDIDDFFAWDDDASDPENTIVDFVGDKGCYFLPTNQDTGENDWLLVGAATAHEALSEIPPDTADYLTDSTGLARAVVAVAPLPANVSEVLAFMPVVYARKEESGSVQLAGGVVVGSSESYAPFNSPSTVFSYMEPGPKTIDPSTGVPWANDADPDLLIIRTE